MHKTGRRRSKSSGRMLSRQPKGRRRGVAPVAALFLSVLVYIWFSKIHVAIPVDLCRQICEGMSKAGRHGGNAVLEQLQLRWLITQRWTWIDKACGICTFLVRSPGSVGPGQHILPQPRGRGQRFRSGAGNGRLRVRGRIPVPLRIGARVGVWRIAGVFNHDAKVIRARTARARAGGAGTGEQEGRRERANRARRSHRPASGCRRDAGMRIRLGTRAPWR